MRGSGQLRIIACVKPVQPGAVPVSIAMCDIMAGDEIPPMIYLLGGRRRCGEWRHRFAGGLVGFVRHAI